MKLIHVADLHLDSKLNRHLDEKRARERRNELLVTFQRLVEYGAEQGVEGILIAGDLFDVAKVSATARNAVLAAMKEHPDIIFYYLRGNHDADAFLQEVLDIEGKLPENLRLFGKEWTSHELTGKDGTQVVITGAEMDGENKDKLALSLLLDQRKINIVMLHGQEVETAGKRDAEVIPLREYKNRGIDYLALGHVHAPKLEKLDARGVYAYAGCLEGRGFDECGPRGFYLLTLQEGQLQADFVPFAQRVMWELHVDVSSGIPISNAVMTTNENTISNAVMTSNDAIACIREALKEKKIRPKDLVKVILTGEVDLQAEFDESYIAKYFEGSLYFVKVVDKTTARIDYERYAKDASLKGEYIRKVKVALEAGKLSADEASGMIRMGIRLLSGEEKLS